MIPRLTKSIHPAPSVLGLLFALVPLLSAQQSKPGLTAARPSSGDEEVVILDEFQVTTTTDNDNYIATDTIGTRTAARLTETPFSIQALTSEFIDDFLLFDPADQLNFIAGGFPGSEETGSNTGKKVRGFSTPVLRDGFSDFSPPHRALVDRVEIIRGPTSALFGQAEPGGLINYVSRRPTRKPKYSLSTTYGPKNNLQAVTLNASGPLVPGKLFYSGAFAYDYKENDMRYYYKRDHVYSLGLTYMLSPRTLLTLALEKNTAKSNQGGGVFLRQETLDGVRWITGLADWLAYFNAQGPHNEYTRDFECASLLVEHRFTRDLVLRANLQTYDKLFDGQLYRVPSSSTYVTRDTRTYEAEPACHEQDVFAKNFGLDLNWRVRTGPVWHSFLLVGDYHSNHYDDATYVQPGPPRFTSISLYNPEWLPLDPYRITQVLTRTIRKTESRGALLSHRGYFFGARLVTMAALRFDEVKRPFQTRHTTNTNRNNPQVATVYGFEDDATTWALGATLKLRGEALVLYANASTGFTPSLIVDAVTGESIPNERSRGFEAGFKGDLLNSRMLYTLSLYDIKKSGVPVLNDLPGADQPQYLGDGSDKARGVDANINWNITSSLFINAGAGYIDGRTRSRRINPPTDRMLNVPRFNAYGALRYAFKEGALKGLRLGASVTHKGDRLAGRATATRLRIESPSETLFGAFIGYGWKSRGYKNSLQLNSANLLDKRYFSYYDYPSPGREIKLTYRLSF